MERWRRNSGIQCLASLLSSAGPRYHIQLIPQMVRNIALIGDERGEVEIEASKSPIYWMSPYNYCTCWGFHIFN